MSRYAWNEKVIESNPSSLVHQARERAEKTPDRAPYTFVLPNGKEQVVSYRNLDDRARALGAALQQRGLTGKPVVLLFEPGVDYIIGFWACLYAGALAVPAYPPDPSNLQRTVPRLLSIIRDAQAAAILATPMIRKMAGFVLGQNPDIAALQWVTSEDAVDPDDWKSTGLTQDSLAFLQYTSGSTGDPKGVILSHGTLVYNTHMINAVHRWDERTRGCIWLPPYHDMGLIGGLLTPVMGDWTIFLLSPMDFLARPSRWVKVMSKYKVTATGGPNFAYDLCARKTTDAERAELDLSALVVAQIAAEPVRSLTMNRFVEAFEPCGFRPETFYPTYGLAEATLLVSGRHPKHMPTVLKLDRERMWSREVVDSDAKDAVEIVGLGGTVFDQVIRIVNPDTLEACSDQQVGEIWISGPNVALGYWQRPELSQATFSAHIKGEPEQRPYLRTGDLGFMRDGQVFITGREKDLIIVRGVNYYPTDVEYVVERHKGVRPGCSVAFSVQEESTEGVWVVLEPRPELSAEQLPHVAAEIRQMVARDVGVHVSSVVFIPKRALPKTSSGKVQRRETRALLLKDKLKVLARFDEHAPVEAPQADSLHQAEEPEAPTMEEVAALEGDARNQALVELVMSIIREELPDLPEDQGADIQLTELGMDSLMTADLLAELEVQTGVRLPLDELMRGATVAALADTIGQTMDKGA